MGEEGAAMRLSVVPAVLLVLVCVAIAAIGAAYCGASVAAGILFGAFCSLVGIAGGWYFNYSYFKEAQEISNKQHEELLSDAEARHRSAMDAAEKKHQAAMADAEQKHRETLKDAEEKHRVLLNLNTQLARDLKTLVDRTKPKPSPRAEDLQKAIDLVTTVSGSNLAGSTAPEYDARMRDARDGYGEKFEIFINEEIKATAVAFTTTATGSAEDDDGDAD